MQNAQAGFEPAINWSTGLRLRPLGHSDLLENKNKGEFVPRSRVGEFQLVMASLTHILYVLGVPILGEREQTAIIGQ